MTMETIRLSSFSILGKQGSTEDGTGFIPALWAEANAHFSEIAHLVKYAPSGSPAALWGAMSNFSLSFLPWDENFTKGLYLAGAECIDGAEPPAGWVRWTVPAFEYLKTENDHPGAFEEMVVYMEQRGIRLAGAVQELTDPAAGKEYLLFPVRKL